MTGVVGTWLAGGTAWRPLLGVDPPGWELRLEDTAPVRALLASEVLQDLVLVMTVTGTPPPWP